MANQLKKEYVSSIFEDLQQHPHFVIVGFENTTHKRFEELRNKLRETKLNTSFSVIKNSLFSIAFTKFNTSKKLASAEEVTLLENETRGKSALMLLPEDWTVVMKAFQTFAKDEEGLTFRVGVIDGKMYTKEGLDKLAALPGKDVLIVKIIVSLKSSQTRIVYGMNFNMMKLVHILKQAKSVEN